MKKNECMEYIAPQIKYYEMDNESIICASVGGIGNEGYDPIEL